MFSFGCGFKWFHFTYYLGFIFFLQVLEEKIEFLECN